VKANVYVQLEKRMLVHAEVGILCYAKKRKGDSPELGRQIRYYIVNVPGSTQETGRIMYILKACRVVVADTQEWKGDVVARLTQCFHNVWP